MSMVINFAKRLLRHVLQSVSISKADINKIVDYADVDGNGMISGEEFFNLFIEYRSIKK